VTVLRAFPVIYANDVRRTAEFWERLGFERFAELPWNDEPGYIGLRRDASEIAVVIWDWRAQRLGLKPVGPQFEMCVCVDDLDALVSDLLDDGRRVLARVAYTPWGEKRVATIADPDGNPVKLCHAENRLANST
jgi:lactoylglutathione lyase